MSHSVTTWYLEQTSPADLAPAGAPPAEQGVRIVRSEVPSPEFSRFLYTAVGGDVLWTDRLSWTYARWAEHLGRPGTETWVAYERGTPAGFIELNAGPEGSVEVAYFGLLPAFRGRRIGGWLLTYGLERAWDLAGRWPGLERTTRVWVHTCSDDGPYARANYERRGFRVYETTVTEEAEVAMPGPWPGAGPIDPVTDPVTDSVADSVTGCVRDPDAATGT
ncbi:GNAT family N-acetyltransferase [Streptomyces natalensis]|uniref:GNAT family N-acetyltransferase n=1 Tax=Streptomyces natalensis TaxID=68242 RepID=UPI00099CFE8F|nr:GNAT family N-acetyltransferase [Streptomyces natalensis]